LLAGEVVCAYAGTANVIAKAEAVPNKAIWNDTRGTALLLDIISFPPLISVPLCRTEILLSDDDLFRIGPAEVLKIGPR
jgi:hypothetical protein